MVAAGESKKEKLHYNFWRQRTFCVHVIACRSRLQLPVDRSRCMWIAAL
jgi:hypothetical protein